MNLSLVGLNIEHILCFETTKQNQLKTVHIENKNKKQNLSEEYVHHFMQFKEVQSTHLENSTEANTKYLPNLQSLI